MDIDVLLLGRAFGFVGSTIVVVSINQNKQLSETNSYKFVDKREVDVDDHRADNVVKGTLNPAGISVASRPGEAALLHVALLSAPAVAAWPVEMMGDW